jgi:hypothetical protein
VFGWFIAD